MLTNLNFLKAGEIFPPASESARLKMYADNKALFETEHASVYADTLKRIERVIGNFQDVISYPVIVNFQKKISLKTADLLLGEPPIITGDEDTGDTKQNAIDAIVKNSGLFDIMYQAAIDASRYGDGLLLIRKDGDHGIIDLTQPPLWFPIVSEDNIRSVQYHVLAWRVGEERLKVQIHSKGSYEVREYQLERGTIVKQINTGQVIQTGLDDFAVIQISNMITSDRVTGFDDYTDVDSIVADLMVRIGQVDRILDKHASPSMSGPQSALEQDPKTGEWRLVTSNYFPRDTKEDPPVEYIVWEGQLSANFTQIEKLINLLYSISEMGSALFGDLSTKTGDVPSGSALKRLMISPLAKVSRMRTHFNPGTKKAIALCSQLGGKGIAKLTVDDISINWQDGLPADFKEDAEIMKTRTAGKATMSQHRALVTFDAMSDEQADEELARIQDDEAATMPLAVPLLGQGDPSEEEEE